MYHMAYSGMLYYSKGCLMPVESQRYSTSHNAPKLHLKKTKTVFHLNNVLSVSEDKRCRWKFCFPHLFRTCVHGMAVLAMHKSAICLW